MARGLAAGFTAALVLFASGCAAAPSGPKGSTPSDTSSSAILGLPPCAKHPTILRVGSRVSAEYLASIEFLSPSDGIGVTFSTVMCAQHRSRVGGIQTKTEPYPERLAVTRNAGTTWTVEGSQLPKAVRSSPGPPPSLAFTTITSGWVAGNGALAGTADEGTQWTLSQLGSRVVGLGQSGNETLALTSPRAGGTSGSWRLWHTSGAGTSWQPGSVLPIPAVDALTAFALGPAPGWAAVAVTHAITSGRLSALVVTSDAGSTWTTRESPCASKLWFGMAAIAIPAPAALVSVCEGSGATGSTPKGIYVSQNAGATWSPRALLPTLGTGDPTGLPPQDFASLGVNQTGELWIATINELSGSRDGGYSWSAVPGVNLGGSGAVFSFIRPLDGWMLAPGAGLWRTTNGRTWVAVGA
ncbi:MAG TPA: hypothetical protein VNF75_05160 [Candidatus Dormibacteraeota bacterium]|nr:hypothetical protein [Candidatus Dormibacteraeota bacterium]